jgi:hypothetical protein
VAEAPEVVAPEAIGKITKGSSVMEQRRQAR